MHRDVIEVTRAPLWSAPNQGHCPARQDPGALVDIVRKMQFSLTAAACSTAEAGVRVGLPGHP